MSELPDAAPATETGAAPFDRRATTRSPRLRLDVVGVVFAGGFAGGALRYALTSTTNGSAGGFPWTTFAVNLAGAFVLTLIIVLAAEFVPSRYVRPLLGTGFCGALTTFSAVAVAADEMLAHRHPALAIIYVLATVAGGLAAAALGLVAGRAAVAGRRRAGERSRS